MMVTFYWYRLAQEWREYLLYWDWLGKGKKGWASLVAQMVKSLPEMQETQVQSVNWEDPLEKEMATHSSILAWRIPWNRKVWWATVHGVTKSQTWLSD